MSGGPVLRYWDDLQVGEEETSPGRTVTEADIVAFAGLSGDYNEIHTNEDFASKGMFKTRIAHGLLGLAIASGLFTRTSMLQNMQRNVMAFLGLNWSFRGPIKAGDTIYIRVRIASKKESKDPARGVITLKRDVINQRGEVVQEGETNLMIRRKASA